MKTDNNMTLSQELLWRGLLNQHTFGDIKELDKAKFCFYHGFDASADSQTIGNLAAMMVDRIFMKHGHKAIILAGGATSLIGDPGGKDKERTLQTEETIAKNVQHVESQLKRIFTGFDFLLVNNIDWLKDLKLLEFLRDTGKHFSMTPLVQRDYIARRIGDGGGGISYTEFSYTLLQGYDFQHLYDKYSVNLQIGGSDQWGNCLSGVDLIRRSRKAEVHAITLPLIINNATGKKFGKSEDGAVWLDDSKTSIYSFYQFWLNIDDASVGDYLKIFTDLDKPTIEQIMDDFNANKANRLAQKKLAYEVTSIVHGDRKAEVIRRVTDTLFGEQGNYTALTKEDFELLAKEVGLLEVKVGASLMDCLTNASLANSRTDARRHLDSNAIYLNGNQIPLGKKTIDASDLINGYCVLRLGKNRQVIVKVSG